MAQKPTYKYSLSLDEESKAIIDGIVTAGKAPNFTDAVRYCIRQQKENRSVAPDVVKASPKTIPEAPAPLQEAPGPAQPI